MDLIFEIMDCNDTEKRRLEVFLLMYSTADWWETVKAIVGEEATRIMAWPTFKA